MKIVDEHLLDKFRTPGKCEVCGVRVKAREPHHLLSKGMGGGSRLDVAENIVAVGRSAPFPLCPCHSRIHDGHISRAQLVAIIGRREGMKDEAVMEYLWSLKRARQ